MTHPKCNPECHPDCQLNLMVLVFVESEALPLKSHIWKIWSNYFLRIPSSFTTCRTLMFVTSYYNMQVQIVLIGFDQNIIQDYTKIRGSWEIDLDFVKEDRSNLKGAPSLVLYKYKTDLPPEGIWDLPSNLYQKHVCIHHQAPRLQKILQYSIFCPAILVYHSSTRELE